MSDGIDFDSNIMHRVISLARLGEGIVHSEPLIGAAVAKGGKIKGIGYNNGCGSMQAVLLALEHEAEDTVNASLYLNFEPDLCKVDSSVLINKIIERGIKNIIIAMKNSNQEASGRWVNFLRNRGIVVKCGLLKNEAEKVNEIYIKYSRTSVPFVILKTAVGISEGIAKSTVESQWITEMAVRELIKRTKRRVMGIMIGIGTVLTYDPILVSEGPGKIDAKPLSIVLDSILRIPLGSEVFKASKEHKLIIACTERADAKKMEVLEREGAIVIMTPENKGMVNLPFLLKRLGNMGIDSLLVEGGGKLAFSVLRGGIADKILCFTAPKMLQSERGDAAFQSLCNINDYRTAVELQDIKCLKAGQCFLIEGYNRRKFDFININGFN